MDETFYEQISQWYDLEFAEFDADLDLYLGYAGIVGAPILELGCGTGRVLHTLASAGYKVAGIDSSPTMLQFAKDRFEREALAPIPLHLGDMRELDAFPESSQRMVFCAINSFLHLPSREDQLAVLTAVRRVLHADGILILDILHPVPSSLQAMDEHLTLDGHWDLPDSERLDRMSVRRVHPAEQLIETTLYYDRAASDGSLSRSVARYSMRYIHRFEMEGLLDSAGFALEGVYGSYALDPLEDSSPVMIFVAHRR